MTLMSPEMPRAAGPDSGHPNSGPPNSGPPNSGPPDSGPSNSGPPDSGHPGTGSPWPGLARQGRFFRNAEIDAILHRGLAYVQAGVCLHLSGHAGFGKTTLALRIAELRGRPVSFMTGNEWLTSRDFIGGEIGQTVSSVVDRYIQSVRRSETTARTDWKDSILATAMQRGHTLVYDEFTRAPPKANAVLLSVLEEGVLVATDHAARRACVEAHPEFRILLTSNPHDYQGVSQAPDALIDRMVTLTLAEPSAETLAGIVAARSGLAPGVAWRVVDLVARARNGSPAPALCSMRASILICRIAAFLHPEGRVPDTALAQIAADVLAGRGLPVAPPLLEEMLARPAFAPVRHAPASSTPVRPAPEETAP